MGRIKFAAWLTAQAFQEHPILIPVSIAVLDAIAGFIAQPLADGSKDLNSLEAFAIGALAGTVLLLLLIFAYYWGTAPRRILAVKVDSLSEKLDQIEQQLIVVAQQVMGDPTDLIPVYQECRSEIRESIRKIGNAAESDQLWGFLDRLPSDHWRKEKQTLRDSPWGRDHYGTLDAAYGHVDRLNTASSTRWFKREVREGDDLDFALSDLLEADQALSEQLGDLSFAELAGDGNQLELEEGDELA
ncbi:MAG TPA: hypothetical protein VJ989_07510 [Solirubrobacterales bacterium]|nr:hypothetical protein [Solirubrobacterales bacterium]